MKHGWQFFGAALFTFASFSLEASQFVVPMLAQKFTAPLTSNHDISTWLLIAAGCIAVVIARKRI